MNEIYSQLLYIAEIIILTIIGISLFQRGFFWTWLRVRIQPKKLILIKCFGGKDPYYRVGRIENSYQRIIFKDLHSKQPKSICISNPKTAIYRDMGIQCTDVDTQKDAIYEYETITKGMEEEQLKKYIKPETNYITIDYFELSKAVTGHDGEKYEGLCLRHLYRPSLMEDQLKKQLWILIIIMLITLITLYYVYKLTKGLGFVSAQIGDVRTLLINQTGAII